MSDHEQRVYAELFGACDTENSGKVTGPKASELFLKTGLSQDTLHQVEISYVPLPFGRRRSQRCKMTIDHMSFNILSDLWSFSDEEFAPRLFLRICCFQHCKTREILMHLVKDWLLRVLFRSRILFKKLEQTVVKILLCFLFSFSDH